MLGDGLCPNCWLSYAQEDSRSHGCPLVKHPVTVLPEGGLAIVADNRKQLSTDRCGLLFYNSTCNELKLCR